MQGQGRGWARVWILAMVRDQGVFSNHVDGSLPLRPSRTARRVANGGHPKQDAKFTLTPDAPVGLTSGSSR